MAMANFGPDPAGLQQITDVVKRLVSIFVGLGFVAAFVMVVWAGIKYLTSGGEPKQIQAAHQVVTWAFIGIIFMAIGWLSLKLIEALTGAPVTVFDIGVLCKFGSTDWCVKK